MILRLENKEKPVELKKDESEVSKKVREIERKKRKHDESEKDDQTDREKRNIGAKRAQVTKERIKYFRVLDTTTGRDRDKNSPEKMDITPTLKIKLGKEYTPVKLGKENTPVKMEEEYTTVKLGFGMGMGGLRKSSLNKHGGLRDARVSGE